MDADMRPVKEADGKWHVHDEHGNHVGGPFDTEAQAWAAIPGDAPAPPRPRY